MRHSDTVFQNPPSKINGLYLIGVGMSIVDLGLVMEMARLDDDAPQSEYVATTLVSWVDLVGLRALRYHGSPVS